MTELSTNSGLNDLTNATQVYDPIFSTNNTNLFKPGQWRRSGVFIVNVELLTT